MKMNFWKVFAASLLAVVVGSVVSSFISLFFFVGLSGMFAPINMPEMTSQTIVKIDFAESITDAPMKNPFENLDYSTMAVNPSTNLLKVLQAIETSTLPVRARLQTVHWRRFAALLQTLSRAVSLL